jgi:hypothetical protein
MASTSRVVGGGLAVLAALGCAWLLLADTGDPDRDASAGQTARAPGDAPALEGPVLAQANATDAAGAGEGRPDDPAGDDAEGAGRAAPDAAGDTSGPDAGDADASALPRLIDGTVDFGALGLTGDEPGAELLGAADSPEAPPLRYGFRLGDAWLVDTWYRNMQSGRGDSWSEPIRWRFHAERHEVVEGVRCLAVSVRMVSDQGVAPEGAATHAMFYVTEPEVRLVAADLPARAGGKDKVLRVRPQVGADGAQGLAGTIVPWELPPQGIGGRLVRGRLAPDLLREGAETNPFPDASKLVGAGGAWVEVRFRAAIDGTPVFQRWAAEDLRWPAVSITTTRRSYRVQGS